MGSNIRPISKRPLSMCSRIFPALQDHSVLSQNDIVIASHKKRNAKLFLKLGDLPGQCRLRHMKLPGRLCKIFFPRYR